MTMECFGGRGAGIGVDNSKKVGIVAQEDRLISLIFRFNTHLWDACRSLLQALYKYQLVLILTETHEVGSVMVLFSLIRKLMPRKAK